MRKSLSLILPINKVGNVFSDVFSPGSIAELQRLNEFVDVAMLLVAQGAFDEAAQARAIAAFESAGLEIRVAVQPEENPCRMARLRQIAALLKPESDYYMFMNDYMEFCAGSTAKYIAAIEYMEKNPTCGSLGNYGHFGSVSYGDEIRPDAIGKIAATAKGLMIKNVFEGRIFPDEVVEMPGPYEEMAAIIWLNLNGLYYAKQFKVPTKTKRYAKRVTDLHIEGDNNLHNATLGAANIRAWIRRVTDRPYYLYGDAILNLGFGFKPKGRAA